MNPMPETIWAAIRDGSSATFSRPSMSANPYFEITMMTAAPSPTRVWVRKPAALAPASRSSPMAVESTSASRTGQRIVHWSAVDHTGEGIPGIVQLQRVGAGSRGGRPFADRHRLVT